MAVPAPLLPQTAETVVRAIIRRRLGVSLNPLDDSRNNQDGLDVLQNVFLELSKAMQRGERLDSDAEIQNAEGYAASVAKTACSEYLRGRYPERQSLKNRVRYFLGHHPQFGVWKIGSDMVCGKAVWANANLQLVNPATVTSLEHDRVLDQFGHKDPSSMKPPEWTAVFTVLFARLEAPIPLDDLVNLLRDVFGIREHSATSSEEEQQEMAGVRNAAPNPEEETRFGQLLTRFWEAFREMPVSRRFAFLLNVGRSEFDLQWLPAYGVASVEQIGVVMELSREQLARLMEHLPISEEERVRARSLVTPEERFLLLWRHLPLGDPVIGHLLGQNAQYVANQRLKAREHLAHSLRLFL